MNDNTPEHVPTTNTENEKADVYTLIDIAMKAHLEGVESFDISTLPDVDIRVTIRGDDWSGYVDTRLADYVIKAEKELRDSLLELGFNNDELPDILVKLKVEEGCTKVLESLKDLLESIKEFKDMPPKEIIKVVAAVGFITLCINAPSLISSIQESNIAQIKADAKVEKSRIESTTAIEKSKNDVEADKVEMERDKIMSDGYKEILKVATDIERREFALQRPVKSLIKKMKDSDTIQIGEGQKMNKATARKKLATSDRSKMTDLRIDAVYTISVLNTPMEGKEWKVVLNYGDIPPFTAVLKLDSFEHKKFMKAFDDPDEGASLALHVTARVNAKGIGDAEVVGLGSPREESLRPSQAISAAKGIVLEEKQAKEIEKLKKDSNALK